MSTYLFDNEAAQASDRFSSLEQCYDKVTTQHLDQLGVAEGWHCLEVGGGGGSIAHWLASRVGETGTVLATDIDPERMYATAGNLEIRRHDIVTDELPEAYFDLVHARLVLIHVPQRVEALARILRALKPGGTLLLDEFDCTWPNPVLTAPAAADAALIEKVIDGIHQLLGQAGMDPAWARKAYGAMRDAGFTDLGYSGFCERWPGGSVGAHLHRANAEQVGPKLIAEGLATQPELDRFLELLDDPEVTLSSYLLLSTWGSRPA
ncbi:MAG: class I SAM-dependent methyltransferase [Micromonosporaceae bacterium]